MTIKGTCVEMSGFDADIEHAAAERQLQDAYLKVAAIME